MTDHSKLSSVLRWYALFVDGPIASALNDASDALEECASDRFDSEVDHELRALQAMLS
jgi:hypothetical protein